MALMDYWILDENHQVVAATAEEWGKMLGDWEQRLVRADNIDDWHISTVFLGVDHGYGRQVAPVLFETMVFGPDPFDGWCQRYCTWDEAVAGHAMACEMVKGHSSDAWDAMVFIKRDGGAGLRRAE